MSNHTLNFDTTELTKQLELLKTKLPTPGGDKIFQGLTTLLTGLSEAVDSPPPDQEDFKQSLRGLEEAIKNFHHEFSQRLQSIEQLITDLSEKFTASVAATDRQDSMTPDSPEIPVKAPVLSIPQTETVVIPGAADTDKRPSRKGAKKKGEKKDPKDPREYCWNLAQESAEDVILEKIENWETAPSSQPVKGDLIVHGTFLQGRYAFSPVWICPIEEISAEFSDFSNYFPHLKRDGQIWLSFDWTLESDIKPPQWFANRSHMLPLWYKWFDLLSWALLAPEAHVFVRQDCGCPQEDLLKENRKAICKTLFDIHSGFESVLQQLQYHGFISNLLHTVYSAFHQFLLPEDLNAGKRHHHAFAILRQAIRPEVKKWREHLNIKELHEAGTTGLEYLGGVKEQTKNNVAVPQTHSFSTESPFEKTKVLYWMSPFWKRTQADPGVPTDLTGCVLYYD